MIIVRSMHDTYLSNAYLVAPGAHTQAIIIDSGAPLEPLLDAVAEHDLTVTHLLTTHEHIDHTLHDRELEERFDLQVMDTTRLLAAGSLTIDGMSIAVLPTPGHVGEHATLLINDAHCFTGDVLFRGTVGGTIGGGPEGYDQLRRSIMDVLLELDDRVIVYPGHTDATTIGDERANNPFVRYWLGQIASLGEQVTVHDRSAVLHLWADDYDGGHKALVEFVDGREAIVGGSNVQRLQPA